MRSFLTYIILLLLFATFGAEVSTAAERKELKDLKQYIKTSNFGKGRELIDKCRKDTTINQSPELYALAAALERKANDNENEKLYLKQKYDTAAFFTTVYKIVEYTLEHDRALLQQKEATAIKTRKQKREALKVYYPNLYNGGVYFVKKQNWDMADKLLTTYITLPTSDVFKGDKIGDAQKLTRAAFMSMRACYEAKKYDDVFKFHTLAETDSANIEFVLQYEALSREQMKDEGKYLASLRRGLRESKSPEFYFTRLVDHFSSRRDYLSALMLNDSILQTDSTNVLYVYAKVVTLFNMKSYSKCALEGQRLKKLDPSNVMANYYIGISYYCEGEIYRSTIAPNLESKDYKRFVDAVNDYYIKACPYLEQFRRDKPGEKDKWYEPLCKIYFSLNKSKELKELEDLK